MKLHNLGTVIAFEVRRTLLKPSFWGATLAVPLLFIALFTVSWLSTSSAEATVAAQSTESVAFTYSDASGIIVPEVAATMGGTPTDDPTAATAAVQNGQADLFISIPEDPATQGVEVIGRDIGLVESTRWASVAQNLLSQSATARINDPRLTGVLAGVPVTSELWVDGHRSAGWGSAIVPGMFLVLLFLSLIMLGQQMLNITMEEKENRVSEMILTTINPTPLIVGKVIGVVILGIIQGLVLMLPLLVWVLLPTSETTTATLGSVDIIVDVPTILAAGALFLAGFLMLTGILVAIGAIMPTAKDANGAFSAVLIANLLPLYTIQTLVTEPGSPLALGLTFFPLTAPFTSLTRLALGALPFWQGALAFALVATTAYIALRMGIRVFREGSIAYGQRLSLRRLLPRRSGVQER